MQLYQLIERLNMLVSPIETPSGTLYWEEKAPRSYQIGLAKSDPCGGKIYQPVIRAVVDKESSTATTTYYQDMNATPMVTVIRTDGNAAEIDQLTQSFCEKISKFL